jgi:hypothetical protein
MRTTSRPLRTSLGSREQPLRKRTAAALGVREASAGLVARGVNVRPSDVVFVKSLVEDSEGLAGIFAERGGELVLAAPASRAADLDLLLADLEREIGATIVFDPFADESRFANPHETEGAS